MERKLYVKQVVGVLAVATFICVSPGIAQTQSGQSQPSQNQTNPSQSGNDRDTTRSELASFDQFLDGHREIAEQIRKDPSLVNNRQFVQSHPALQTYLQQHPNVSGEIKENPSAFMRQENRYDRREDARADRDRDMNRPDADRNVNTRRDADNRQDARDDRDRDNDRRDADNRNVNRQNTDARQDAREDRDRDNDRRDADNRNVNRQNTDARQDARDDRDSDRRDADDRRGAGQNRGELERLDRFLDSHREISEQVKKDPNLLHNQQYLREHPALQSFLQQNPGIRQQASQQPYNLVWRENRYDQREDARRGDMDRRDQDNVRDMDNRQGDRDMDSRRGDRDMDYRQAGRNGTSDRPELASFDRFLDSHRELSEQLRRDPSLVNNQQFVQSHPALQSYLQQNPNVRQSIDQNPNAFMRQENQYDRREDMNRGHSMEAANFREFLGSHSNISQDLSRDPHKANDVNYQNTHPEFRSYLSAHPQVQVALNQNPENFMKTVQQPAATPTTGTTGTTKPSTTPETKPPTKP